MGMAKGSWAWKSFPKSTNYSPGTTQQSAEEVFDREGSERDVGFLLLLCLEKKIRSDLAEIYILQALKGKEPPFLLLPRPPLDFGMFLSYLLRKTTQLETREIKSEPFSCWTKFKYNSTWNKMGTKQILPDVIRFRMGSKDPFVTLLSPFPCHVL